MKWRFSDMHWFSAVALVYLLLNLILPANHTTKQLYHLSNAEYHILIFLILLPYIAIWFAAFYGYSHLREYAAAIHRTKEGSAFAGLSEGARWLAWGLPIPAFISLILTTIANSHPGFTGTSTIISNYVTMAVQLVAFNYISSASRDLLQKAKLQVSAQTAKLLVLAFVSVGVLFCYFIFRNLNSLSASSTHSPYYLPTWLLIITLVIPYLYAWLIGLLAAYEMWSVGKHAAGLLYRRGLQTMSWALIIIISASIAIQYINSVIPSKGHLSLGYIIVLVYIFLFLYAVGFILLAIASNRLKKIEEV